MFAEFDKNKEVFLSPSVLPPPRFVLRLLLTTHYYLPHLANEFNKQQTKKGKIETMFFCSYFRIGRRWGSETPKYVNSPLS